MDPGRGSVMTWEYRVMSRRGELAIYEVYYDPEGRVVGYGASPAVPAGPDINELRANCELYAAALEKPELEYREDE